MHEFAVAGDGGFVDLPEVLGVVFDEADELVVVAGESFFGDCGVEDDVVYFASGEVLEEGVGVEAFFEFVAAPCAAFGVHEGFAGALDGDAGALVAHGDFGDEHPLAFCVGADEDAGVGGVGDDPFGKGGEASGVFAHLRHREDREGKEGDEDGGEGVAFLRSSGECGELGEEGGGACECEDDEGGGGCDDVAGFVANGEDALEDVDAEDEGRECGPAAFVFRALYAAKVDADECEDGDGDAGGEGEVAGVEWDGFEGEVEGEAAGVIGPAASLGAGVAEEPCPRAGDDGD